MNARPMTVKHKEKFLEVLHAGSLETEVLAAVDYCKGVVTKSDWMQAAAIACQTSTPKQVLSKFNAGAAGQKTYTAEEVKFGGVLGMLDLEDRAKPTSEMDTGRMKWACELLDSTHRFSKILGDIVVRAEFPSDDNWAPGVLRRVEADAVIDVVCLSLFWHKPKNAADEHPLKNLCRDLIYSAVKVGQGIDLEVERFKRKVDEDKKGT